MENASKALLIAASVLIVILLIAFGMSIFKSGTGTGDALEDTMSATEKASFNSKFTAYCGTSKSAAQAKALANVVVSNNSNSTYKVKITMTYSKDRTISLTDEENAQNIVNNVSQLSGSGKIEATIEDGIVTKMTLTY